MTVAYFILIHYCTHVFFAKNLGIFVSQFVDNGDS